MRRSLPRGFGAACATLALSLVATPSAVADDCVGWLRVHVPTGGVAAAAMPFEPLGDGSPASFLSGRFAEDSGLGLRDELAVVSGASGTLSRAVWSSGSWREPGGGQSSAVAARPSDSLVLRLLPSDPFDVFLFGRVPLSDALASFLPHGLSFVSFGYPSHSFPTSSLPSGVSVDAAWSADCADGVLPWTTPVLMTNANPDAVVWERSRPYPVVPQGLPQALAMSVDDDGRFADFSVAAAGATDVLRLSSPSGFPSAPVWAHLVRLCASQSPTVWRDSDLGDSEASFYRFADAALDTDGDGLPDALETLVYGTSPYLADTDGDGVSDLLEVTAGTDPLVPEDGSGFLFAESFERPSVVPGPLGGQNGWTATDGASAVVQTNGAADGAAALVLRPLAASEVAIETSHSLSGAPHVVWVDVRASGTAGLHERTSDTPSAAAFGFDCEGHPVMFVAGGGAVTNMSVVVDDDAWTRCTAMLDYGRRTWDFYVDGIVVGRGLPLGGVAESASEVALSGLCGRADALAVSAARPAGLSSDGDALPDEWEVAHFGGLGRDGSGDVVEIAVLDADAEVASASASPLTVAMDSLAEGRHGISVVARDDSGAAVTNSHEVEVRPFPRGYAPGIAVDYYSFDHALSSMPEFGGLDPVATGVVSAVNYPRTAAAWDGAPTNLVDRFAATFDGAFWIEEAGIFDVKLTSDDGSRLFLDGSLAIDHGGTHSMTAKRARLPLSRGMHSLRLEYFENFGDAGLMLSVSDASGAAATPRLFRRVAETDDSDGDGMPDWWESLYGLDPLDASDADSDPDGDGLANGSEFIAGTDPLVADTDSDGMPDTWEAAHGLCAFVADGSDDDLDGDGLPNVGEFLAGTDPANPDTDGDGCPDGIEARNVRSDPLVADIAWLTPAQVGGVTAASAVQRTTGTWRTDTDGGIHAAERAGSLTWSLTVPPEGADALSIRLGQHEMFSQASTFDLSLYVDGVFVCRQVVDAPYGDLQDACFFIPEVSPGEHDFRLVWRNWERNTFLAVKSLRFAHFSGPDADGNGVPDWKDARSAESSQLREPPCESLVSPLCVEGRDLWRDVLEVSAESDETNAVYAVVKTIGDGFYVDVPLSETGVTRISLADRALSNAFDVVWREFDAYEGAYLTNALVIRAGDALRIAGCGSRESEVTISRASDDGEWLAVTNWTQSAPTPYRFLRDGLHLVSVSTPGLLVGTDDAYALVDVVESRFPMRNPVILQDGDSALSCPILSPRNLLEHDSGLLVTATHRAAGGLDLALSTSRDSDLGLVSRLGDGEAISDAIQVTPVWADNGSYYHVAKTYPDGSQLVEVSLLLGAMTDEMSVRLTIFVAGVTFEDGTRAKTLLPDDFDEDGRCVVRFVKARGVTTSVCHRTTIFQNGARVFAN